MKTMRVMMAVVFVAAVTAVATSVVVIQQSNRISTIERRIGSGSLDQVAVEADRDAHNRHFSLPSPQNTDRLDGVLLPNDSAFLLGGDIKDPPSGTYFQLWAQTSAGAISLGVLGENADKPFFFRLPSGTDHLFVTTEAKSGATAPTVASIVVSGPLPT